MKRILILGANGQIAQIVTEMLTETDSEVYLTSRKAKDGVTPLDVLSRENLETFFEEHPIDIVYANLGVHGHQAEAAQNITAVMEKYHVSRLIWIATAGIYDEISPENKEAAYKIYGSPFDPTTYFGEQAAAAKIIEKSSLDYTILRPNALTNEPEIEDLTIQTDRDSINGAPVSRRSIADVVTKILLDPVQYEHESIAISKRSNLKE